MQTNNHKQPRFSLDDLFAIAQRLRPDKKVERTGSNIRVSNNDSLSLKEPGQYYDHEIGQGGGIIDLVMRTLPCDFKTALSWCNDLKALPITIDRQYTDKPKSKNPKERTAKALKTWGGARGLKGTLGERYFRSRSITIALPESLRFKPRMWHTNGKDYPAIIAPVYDVEKRFIAIHAIYIDPVTGKKIADAKPKLSFGPISGGAVRLSPLKETLVITEGIEDGLSLLQMGPDLTVWPCLGTSGLRSVEIPTSVKEVIIAADNDEPSWKAAYLKRSELRSKGYTVHIRSPKDCKDYNELLCRGSNAS